MIAIRWQNIFDFLALALAIYLVLRWGREARAFRVALVILGLRAGSILARQLDLVVTGLILDAANLIAIILLLIAYQIELRRALSRLDVLAWLAPRRAIATDSELDAIGAAAFELAQVNCGALIVIEHQDSLNELIDGGVKLGGQISAEILEAVFRKNSPVHDGAVIIEGDQIARVGALLPMTRRMDVPQIYGTRHRAAIGLAERSDATVIVVSEERGQVSVAEGGRIQLVRSAVELSQTIRATEKPRTASLRSRLRDIVFGHIGLKAAALGLALLFWSISFFLVGNSIRTVTVPVEFTNVPADLEISRTSADTIEVQVRGSAWLLDSVSLNTLVGRFDLSGKGPGTQTIPVGEGILNLPPGLVIENISPGKISMTLVSSQHQPSQ